MERSIPSHARQPSLGGNALWVDGLLCAYELIPSAKRMKKAGQKSGSEKEKVPAVITTGAVSKDSPEITGESNVNEIPIPGTPNIPSKSHEESTEGSPRPHDGGAAQSSPAGKETQRQWVPIGWARIGELAEYVQKHSMPEDDDSRSDDGSGAVADQAAPFWQLQTGPIWWCHVLAGHPHVMTWLTNAQWLHPAISSGLRDESRLISERMKHLFYEVPVRVGGGLLFELLGHSVGDPHRDEDDVPIVLRSWASLNFLITAMHLKGRIPHGLNVIGISEVQDMMGVGGASAPQTAHEVVAFLAYRLARWDDRLFRKHYFGAADEVELKFVSRHGDGDLALLSIILNQEIKRLSTQVIRVKWALHAREEISYDLQAHLRGKNTKAVLGRIAARTTAMLEEQEAVCDRLFTVQDVMQSTLHASLQDSSVRVMHNFAVIGSVGLVLTLIVSLFGTNVGGIPGKTNAPHAFGFFTLVLCVVAVLLVGLGMKFLRFRDLPTEEQLASRKKELHHIVTKFKHAAEAHEKVREVPRKLFQ